MSYTQTTYEDVEPKAPGMYFLREALDCENLGLTVVDVDAGWTGMEHDHTHDDQEEVYLVVEGEATATVDGDDVSLAAGDAVRVDSEASRQFHAESDLTMVVAGAP